MTSGAANVVYSGEQDMSYSASLGGSEFEDGSSALATEKSQFTFAKKASFDALVDRTVDDLDQFVGGAAITDAFTFEFTNDTELKAALNAGAGDATLTLVLESDFGAAGANGFTGTTSTDADGNQTAVAFTGLDPADTAVTYTPIPTVAIPLNAITYSAVVVGRDGANAEDVTVELATAQDAGQWELNASVVNVPYLPVGYGLTPNIEIANAGSTDAAISLEAFDQFGNEYPRKEISVVAKKNSVTKVSEADMQAAFGIGAGVPRKLSVTVVVDADAEDITLVPYYRQGDSRMGVITDQYKASNVD